MRSLLPIILLALSASRLSAQPWAETIADDTTLFRSVLEIPGRYVNDHALVRVDGRWHLFYTTGRSARAGRHWSPEGNELEIGHATSLDLETWEIGPPALRVGPAGSLDAGHIYAPAVIERAGVWYMFYTGTPYVTQGPEHLLLATSKDLKTWTKHPGGPVVRPDTGWASYYPPRFMGGAGGPVSGRDPFVIADSRFGYIMYYVARMRHEGEQPLEEERACIAAATSPDLLNWHDRGPVLVRRIEGEERYAYAHPESPVLVQRAGMNYIFWKGGVGTRYAMSRDPLDFHGAESYLLASSHASELVHVDGRWLVTSCSRNLDDIGHDTTDRTRGLFIAGLEFEGKWPRVVRW